MRAYPPWTLFAPQQARQRHRRCVHAHQLVRRLDALQSRRAGLGAAALLRKHEAGTKRSPRAVKVEALAAGGRSAGGARCACLSCHHRARRRRFGVWKTRHTRAATSATRRVCRYSWQQRTFLSPRLPPLVRHGRSRTTARARATRAAAPLPAASRAAATLTLSVWPFPVAGARPRRCSRSRATTSRTTSVRQRQRAPT